jgi:hypothetical protein
MHTRINNVYKEIETLKKNKKSNIHKHNRESLLSRLDGLDSMLSLLDRIDSVEKSCSELEDTSMETPQI